MPKSFKNLQTDLRDLGLGVLGEHFLSGTVKSCLSTAPAVGNYLRELGYTVANYGGGREYYNHYDLSVKTIDQGWVSVDPTYMQFHVQHQIDEDDAPITLLDPLMAHFDAITKNGLAAFEIIPLKNERTPSKYEAPQSHLSPDGTWKSYWAWRAEYAAKALAAAEGLARMRRIPSYAASLVAWRLRKTKKNPGMPWLPLETLEDYLPDMRSQGVSKVLHNPRDLRGRFIPQRYLAGLSPSKKRQRIAELTTSRDAYGTGDFSELPSDRTARAQGLVRMSPYSREARTRGIEWRGDTGEMATRVLSYYGLRSGQGMLSNALRQSYARGLAAWKSGGHRPGATARNWADARVHSFVTGGKTTWTGDADLFRALPKSLQNAIEAERKTKKNPSMSWLPLETLEDYLPDMRSQGVSEVARSPRGFVTAYQKAKGDPEKLSEAWHKKRANFIKRHMAQVKKRKEPLFVKGAPSRRHLALIAWAYSPTPSKL